MSRTFTAIQDMVKFKYGGGQVETETKVRK